MHCQKAHADYLILARGAHYILTSRATSRAAQPAHSPALDRRPGRAHQHRPGARASGHKRTLKVVAVSAGIVFPHAVQAIQITRKNRKLTGKKWRNEVIYAVTSLAPAQATDAELAAFIRATTNSAWIPTDGIGSRPPSPNSPAPSDPGSAAENLGCFPTYATEPAVVPVVPVVPVGSVGAVRL